MKHKLAKRLDEIGVWFKGPYSADLFNTLFTPAAYSYYDYVVIGSGESRAVAAARAVAHAIPLNLGSLLDDIQTHVLIQSHPDDVKVEAGPNTEMYCIIAIIVERE